MKRAIIAGAGGLVIAAALLVVPGATFGSFSDREVTPTNAIEATTLEINTAGGTGTANLDFMFDNLLPGAAQTASGTYRNTGRMAQDVWIMFPNAGSLDGVEVHVASNGTEILGSTDIPRVLKLAGQVAPGAGGGFGISFRYSAQNTANPTAPVAIALPYQIVATQPGIAP